MPGDILELIDNALEDWSASDDAMRWNPDQVRVICDGGRLWPERWSVWRHESYHYSIGAITDDGTSVPWQPVTPGVSPAQFAAIWSADEVPGWRSVGTVSELTFQLESAEPIYQDCRPAITGPLEWSVTFTLVAGDIAAALGFWRDSGSLYYHPPSGVHPGIRRRCPVCNPHGNPSRLPIDGHAYARRRAARKRR